MDTKGRPLTESERMLMQIVDTQGACVVALIEVLRLATEDSSNAANISEALAVALQEALIVAEEAQAIREAIETGQPLPPLP